MIFFMASLPCEAYKHLQLVFRQFRNGSLKGQKVPRSKTGIGRSSLELKGTNFKCLRGLSIETIADLLFELVEGKTSLKEMALDCQSYKGIQKVQAAFLKCTDVSSWEEAKIKFPKYACSEMLEPFKRMKFGTDRRIPAEFLSFCQRAVRSLNSTELCHDSLPSNLFILEHRQVFGVFLEKDATAMTTAGLSAVCSSIPHFNGVRLAVFHLSEVSYCFLS